MGKGIALFAFLIGIGITLLVLAWMWAEKICEVALHTSDPSLWVVSFIWFVIVSLGGGFFKVSYSRN
jgi:hypothetical protein